MSNADELLDIVDSRDTIIGAATRAEVHARRLRHRAVHVLVHDTRGRLYVQRRSEFKDCAPGLWDTSAAGHVGHGEDYAGAAPRELAEELGLTDVSMRDLCSLPASAATGWEFVRAYVGMTYCEPRPDPLEIAAATWCTRRQLGAWMAREPQQFTATFRAIFAHYQALASLE